MIRAAALLIVMTLAWSPTGGILCKVWCAPLPAAANGCHAMHSNAPSTIAGQHDCDEAGFDQALAPTDGRLLSVASDGGAAIAPVFATPRSSLSTAAGSHGQQRIPTRPRLTALRI